MLTVLGPLWTIEAQPPAARQAPVMTKVVRAFFMGVFFWGEGGYLEVVMDLRFLKLRLGGG